MKALMAVPSGVPSALLDKRREAISGILAGLEGRRSLDAAAVESLMKYFEPRVLLPRQVLFNAGDLGSSLVILAQGSLQITSADSQTHTLIHAPSVLGAKCLIEPVIWEMGARAVSHAEVLLLDGDIYREWARKRGYDPATGAGRRHEATHSPDSLTRGAPGRVEHAAAVSTGDGIRLYWTLPPGASGCQVFHFNDATMTWEAVAAVVGSEYLIEGTPGERHQKWMLRSFNQDQFGAFSDEIALDRP